MLYPLLEKTPVMIFRTPGASLTIIDRVCERSPLVWLKKRDKRKNPSWFTQLIILFHATKFCGQCWQFKWIIERLNQTMLYTTEHYCHCLIHKKSSKSHKFFLKLHCIFYNLIGYIQPPYTSTISANAPYTSIICNGALWPSLLSCCYWLVQRGNAVQTAHICKEVPMQHGSNSLRIN